MSITAREHIEKLKRTSLLRAMRRGYSVYVLHVDGELVYVGQTADPTMRLKLHKADRKGHHVALQVKYIVETQNEAVRLEGELIRILTKRGFDLENKNAASGTSVPGAVAFGKSTVGEILEDRTVLLPRSGALRGAMTKEEAKERRLQIRKMVAGSARMAEIEK